jgi:hypothetical protein
VRRELAVSPTVADPVQQSMPPTLCPKLRLKREMVAAEEAAKVHDDRMERRQEPSRSGVLRQPRPVIERSSSLGSICAALAWA